MAHATTYLGSKEYHIETVAQQTKLIKMSSKSNIIWSVYLLCVAVCVFVYRIHRTTKPILQRNAHLWKQTQCQSFVHTTTIQKNTNQSQTTLGYVYEPNYYMCNLWKKKCLTGGKKCKHTD